MSEDFTDYLDSRARRVEIALDYLVQNVDSPFFADPTQAFTKRLYEAMRYTLLAGGKRLRPILFYASYEAVTTETVPVEDLDRIAVALECLHGYSLIHDDLPAMDDDDLRRGKASCHRAFDEATAILAGDALQSLGFRLICDCEGIEHRRRLAMVAVLSEAVGPLGMAGGQAIDMGTAGHLVDRVTVEAMHQLKTGALIRAAVRLGAICAAAPEPIHQCLDRYSAAIGLAFQLRDDLLDVESTTETLGKRAGADIEHNKPTYVAVLGVDSTRRRLAELLDEAKAALVDAGLAGGHLGEIADYVRARAR